MIDEKRIILMLRQGDEQAVRAVFDNYYTMMCHVGERMLHDMPAAEAIADDVVFALWQNRSLLNITSSLKPYLLRAVKNRCINRLRSEEWRMRQASAEIDGAEQADFLERLFSDEQHPLGILMCRELQDRLDQSVLKLQPQCRAVFIKSRYEQKSYKQIAAELGISVNTVKYHIKTALAFLSADLKDLIMWTAVMNIIAN